MDKRSVSLLKKFAKEHAVTSKGKLSVVLYVTRTAQHKGLPLKLAELRTPGRGQVQGLSRSSIQSILADYGIHRVLAHEGGRTSRGSLGLMENYVHFINDLNERGLADLKGIERWWVDRVGDFFASQPFVLRYDVGKSIGSMVRDLLDQARHRQEENLGTTYVGAMLQHLVGAKLDLVLKGRGVLVAHYGASVADAPKAREGDFVIDKVAIHVTTAPGQALMQKCKQNLDSGYRPIIVTLHNMTPAAESNAALEGIEGRLDILAADQFLAANLHELSGFQDSERLSTVDDLVERYNDIVNTCETDPSLRINIGK